MNIVGSVFRREVVPITRTIFTDVSPTLEHLAQTESRAAGAALHATENGGREAADLALQQATTTAERNMITHTLLAQRHNWHGAPSWKLRPPSHNQSQTLARHLRGTSGRQVLR